jgi:hypothetical protein
MTPPARRSAARRWLRLEGTRLIKDGSGRRHESSHRIRGTDAGSLCLRGACRPGKLERQEF